MKNQETCPAHVPQFTGLVPKELRQMGIYRNQLNTSLLEIAVELEKMGKIEELKKPTLEEELVLSRLQVMELTKAGAPPGMRLKAIELVGRIARTAKQIQEIDQSKFREEFLDSLINAVTSAFHAANKLDDPADRNRAFINELALFFPQFNAPATPVPGNPDPKDTFEGEVVGVPTGS
jgi:hypothetical protein